MIFDSKTQSEWQAFGLAGYSGGQFLDKLVVESRKVVPTPVPASLTKSYLSSCEHTQAVAKLPVRMGELSTLWLTTLAAVFQAGPQ